MFQKYFFYGFFLLATVTTTNTLADSFIGDAILQSPERTPAFASRDVYRHPAETLEFFGLEPNMTVVEIWPGGGWYTEILAPYLGGGKLYAAHFAKDSGIKYFANSRRAFEEKIKASPDVYQTLTMAEFSPKMNKLTVPDGRADLVLTFRNVHNWLRSINEAEAFALFYKALKPGGILGVVEHRAKPNASWETMKQSGYMSEAYVITLAEKAGFVLDARSEINANPKDSADYPKGVWTLPPTLRMNDKDRAKYQAIGESDRMTLRFKKPGLTASKTAGQ
ncbi:MAG: class I SAM-dependent methyltransferase [Gammaproteobacteria bacterium]|nr:class I SAM-dependent methyltransferase [Gammaproteobacteria bacterium]MBQ0840984.1 class I SAM-dependent methyltransferase [Gammaproteobacteria bacterium]